MQADGETVLSVLVADSASIDITIFRAWVNGLTPRECARLREPALYNDFFGNTPFDQLKPDLRQRWRSAQMLNMQECQEEFQVCEWMTPYLCQPQQVCPPPTPTPPLRHNTSSLPPCVRQVIAIKNEKGHGKRHV